MQCLHKAKIFFFEAKDAAAAEVGEIWSLPTVFCLKEYFFFGGVLHRVFPKFAVCSVFRLFEKGFRFGL